MKTVYQCCDNCIYYDHAYCECTNDYQYQGDTIKGPVDGLDCDLWEGYGD